MTNSPIDEIKNRLDIVDVVKEYVKLEKSGVNYRALCPFHSEKTPSFFISPSRQIWHCFGGCGKGGDIFKFIMEVEGIEFNDALRILAAKAGIELKKQDPKNKSERHRVYEICELATRFFEKKLKENEGPYKYLIKRGIKEESIKEWRVGYSPESWNDLLSFLENKGYYANEIEKAGLVVKKEGTNRYYDRFRGRIIFPIFDLNSQSVGFGGRLFDPEEKRKKEAKYLNTSNTLIYDKSKILYGLDKARTEARKVGFFVLVEGYTDVIMSYQAGITNVASTSGTALTSYQLKILKRYCDNLIMAFDMDAAGDSATKRGIEIAQENDFNIKVALMPEGLDPADLILKDANSWKKIIKESVPIISFFFQTAFSKFDSKIQTNKRKIAETVLTVIKKINSDIEKDFWIKKLAEDLEVSENSVIQDLGKIKSDDSEDLKEEIKDHPIKKDRKHLLEERFLSLIIKNKENLNSFNIDDFYFLSEESKKIINYLKNNESKKESDLEEKINYLAMKSEVEFENIDCQKDFDNCLVEIKTIAIKEKLKGISDSIKKTEKEKDYSKSEDLKKEFNFYCQQLFDINKN